MTLPIDDSENRTRLSLTVSEIFDRKHIALTYFFILIILIIKSFANFVRNDLLNLQRSNRSAFEIHDYNDSNISETITTTETTFVPSGSTTLALDFCCRRNSNISYRFGDIRPEAHSPERRYFLIMPCELVRRHIRVCSSKMENFLMLATAISQKR